MASPDFGSKGWTPDRLGPLDDKTFVITGANAGTGFQAARLLLSKGARVVMLNRSAERSQAALSQLQDEFGTETDISFIQTDLSDLASVRAAGKEIQRTLPQIDALICNAAIAQVPKRELTVDGFESQLGTNHFGQFVLAEMLFDQIEKVAGRVVVVASLGYKMGLRTIKFDDLNWNDGYSPNSAYSQSKPAQMMFAYELQDRITAAGKSTKVYVCHPGSSATSLISTSGGRMMRAIWWLMTKTPMVQTAERGAYPEVMCATETGLEQRALYGPTGRMEFVGPVGKGSLEPYAYDKPVMKRLWEVTENATGHSWAI